MNLTSSKLESNLRVKGRLIRDQIRMLTAQINALNIEVAGLKFSTTIQLKAEQFATARELDRNRIKAEGKIKSLTKIRESLKFDQRNVGLSIQKLISYRDHANKFPETNKFYEAIRFGKLKDEILLLLSSTYYEIKSDPW